MILDSPPITPSQTSSLHDSSSSSSSSLSEPSSPLSSDYFSGSLSPSPSQSSASTAASDDDEDVQPKQQHNHADHPLYDPEQMMAYFYSQMIWRELEFNQNVKVFEQILNEDNKQRGEQQWPQHVIDQIVQSFASLLRQKLF